MHKGFPQFQRELSVHDLRDRLRSLSADVVFLQEVVGSHSRHARRYGNWPIAPQYEFLADQLWSDYAYGKNSVYDAGHHGNAILSKYPIIKWDNVDISMSRLERRGLLHCEIQVPGWDRPLHCINVHLGLFGHWRKRQLELLRHRIERLVPRYDPVIIGGDFNDWRLRASGHLAQILGLSEVFENMHGRPARTYPAMMPFFQLDRIYTRGFGVKQALKHVDRRWAKLSDHIALSAQLERLESRNEE